MCLFDEDVLHRYYERVLHLKHDELLVPKTLQGIMLDDSIFPDALHGVHLAVLGILDEIYLAESAFPNEPFLFEVVK